MKVLTPKQFCRIIKYCKSLGGIWNEGMSYDFAKMVKYNFKLPTDKYFKAGDSYLLHRYGSKSWFCISREFYDQVI